MGASRRLSKFINLVKKLANEQGICKNEIDLLVKRVTIYQYLSPYFLKDINESRALEVIWNRNDITELSYSLNKFTHDDRKELRDIEEIKANEPVMDYSEQIKRYKEGLNGYGPNMMGFIDDSFCNNERRNLFYGKRLLSNTSMNENPKIVFDLSRTFINDMIRYSYKALDQMTKLIPENIESPNPWELNFVGYKPEEDFLRSLKNVYRKVEMKLPGQVMMPSVDRRPPHEYIPPNKKVVYISFKSRRYIDGPLDADYYVINLNYDANSESLAMAKVAGVTPYALPVLKYTNRISRKFSLPFPVIINVLKCVHENGGDWETAFKTHFPIRKLDPTVPNEPSFDILQNSLAKQKDEMIDIRELMSKVKV